MHFPSPTLTASQRKAKARRKEMPTKIDCACGCGERILSISRHGRPVRFVLGHGAKGRSGAEWRTGAGYYARSLSDEEMQFHPTAYPAGWIMRSHYVWNTTHPDDPVLPGECVHHANHDRGDDRPENLRKFSSRGEHQRLHRLGHI